MGFSPWQPGRAARPCPLAARLAVPPAKGLNEGCAWLRKAALTPFPPVTKLSRTTVTERTRLGRELNCWTSAVSLSESSCLLHESRTNIIMDLRSTVKLAHDNAGRVAMREGLDLASPPTGGTRGFLPHPPHPHGKYAAYHGSMMVPDAYRAFICSACKPI